ncbi:hypothetical protein PR048_013332 [Dryococelus australis]|uniref:Uncharacterized protein n=1 Tax=Dryococelus australis TaxID=614101 RepID=A0ABQ9HRV3_9NEOP|nr:hypothetical protein PR048_013332 [Dryococelus australis]
MKIIFQDEPDVLIFMSDKAHLHLNGFINQHNCRYWAEGNLRQLQFVTSSYAPFSDMPLPPRYTELSMCNFSLWGYIKNKAYQDKPHTLNDLKMAICKEAELINEVMLKRIGSFRI